MKLKKILICVISILMLVMTVACDNNTNTKNKNTDAGNIASPIGMWKSDIGLEINIYENGTYKRNTDYDLEKWFQSEDGKSYEFIDRNGASKLGSVYISAGEECLEIEDWGKFYRVYVEEDDNSKDGFEYKLTHATLFKDNRTIIEYEDKNGQKYAALIDNKGNILYKEANAYIANYFNVDFSFSGIGVIVSDQEVYTILNKDGKAVATSQSGDFDKVLAYGDGLAFVYKDKSDINGASHCYGVLDSNGKWKQPLTQINDFASFTQFGYVGEGIFRTIPYLFGNDKTWVYSSKTGKFAKTETKGALMFRGGVAYYEGFNGNYKMDMNLENSAVTDFDRVISGRPVKTVDTDHIQIYDSVTKKTVVLSKYEATQIDLNKMKFSGSDTFLIINGKDGNQYYTIVDENGNEYYEPKKIVAPAGSVMRICDFNFSESKLSYQRNRDTYTGIGYAVFEDINGNIIAENVQVGGSVKDITFGENITKIETRDAYLFVNSKGEIIIKNLYE